VLTLCAVRNTTMNMGARPASKVACRFAEEWLDAWRRQMDRYVDTVWIHTKSAEYREALELRKRVLDDREQGRPYWAAVYTDNFEFTFQDARLMAKGIAIWKRMNAQANIAIAESAAAVGTCIVWIGGRCVLNAGIGCLVPSKLQRALLACRAALEGKLTRDEYESNNSYLGFAQDILGFPVGSLQGITGPLRAPGFGGDWVLLTPQATERYKAVEQLLRTRPFATFWSGINDAAIEWSGVGRAAKMVVTLSSDCCTNPTPTLDNPSPQPHLCGIANGVFWRFCLEGEWLHRHITLTEALGPAVNTLVLAPLHPDAIIVLGCDATAGVATAVWRASGAAPSLQLMQQRLRTEPSYANTADRLRVLHHKGWGNGLADMRSRDDMHGMRRLAASFGVALSEIQLNAAALRFLADVLEATAPYRLETPQFVPYPPAAPQTTGDANPPTSVPSPRSCDPAEPGGTAFRFAMPSPKKMRPGFPISTSPILMRVPRPQSLRHGAMAPGRTHISETEPACEARCEAAQHVEAQRGPHKRTIEALLPSPPRLRVPLVGSRPRPLRRLAADIHDMTARMPTPLHAPRRTLSPQRKSARKARTAAARDIADTLAADRSEYALCPSGPERLRSLVVEASRTRDEGIPKGSRDQDENGFKWVRQFCRSMGETVRWMRPRSVSTPEETCTEIWFHVLAVLYIARNIKASSQRQRLGFRQGKPSSALSALLGYHRVLRDCHHYVPDMREISLTLRGASAQYLKDWGQDALITQQCKPFSLTMLQAIAETCIQRTAALTPSAHACWLALNAFEIATGTRKNEVTEACDGDIFIRRENFRWVDQSAEHLPSCAATTTSRSNGCLLEGHRAPSKCDRTNSEWGATKQYFRYNDTNPLNFAWHWRQWEEAFPCRGDRATWAAFSPNGDERPHKSAAAARDLHTLLVCAIGERDADGRTFHSWRATLASALFAARKNGDQSVTDAVIQTLARWKTEDAMKRYTHMRPEDYADFVDIASRTDAGVALPVGLPAIDPGNFVAEISGAITEMEAPPPREGAAPRRRLATASSSSAADAPASPRRASVSHNLGEGGFALDAGSDSWDLVGTSCSVSNELWGVHIGGFTPCTVVGFLGPFKFADGSKKPAYVVCDDAAGFRYPVSAAYLAKTICDAATKKRVSKLPEPRAVARRVQHD